jgi:hypothetical protein
MSIVKNLGEELVSSSGETCKTFGDSKIVNNCGNGFRDPMDRFRLA